MKSIDNAFQTVISNYTQDVLQYKIIEHIPEKSLWVVNVHNSDAPGSLLQIEVIDDDGIPKCLVLQKINIGKNSMVKFMDRLVNALD